MLRLHKYVLTQLLPSSSASTISPLRRLISAAAPAVSPNPSFAVEDYLVGTCGLTPAQAAKASAKLSHLKCPTNPDAVLDFLADLGLSGADVATLVAKDPLFLCAGVEKTLAPVIVGLTSAAVPSPPAPPRRRIQQYTMLRLHKYVLTQLLPSSSASPLRRLISAAAPAICPNPRFSVEDYLVTTCGLTRAQALKASAKLSHLKSPSKPDAVLAFLADLGLSGADVAALVAKDPKFLCAGMERTLAPVVVGLTDLGLSRPEIARLVSLTGKFFRCRSVASRLPYFLSFFGSHENLLRVLKYNPSLLGYDLDRVVKPNVAFLRECGLGACDIAKLYARTPSPLNISTERIRTAVVCVEGLGVSRGSPMFRHALQAVAFLNEEKITTKVEHLKKMFRWSDAEVGIAFSKAPMLLTRNKESLQRRSEFLISEVGLQPAYIACRSAILTYNLEGRLGPRYYVVKFLKENGLLDHDRDYYAAVMISEKVFVEKFICPHKDAAPHLADDYATACRGEVPARFSFT